MAVALNLAQDLVNASKEDKKPAPKDVKEIRLRTVLTTQNPLSEPLQTLIDILAGNKSDRPRLLLLGHGIVLVHEVEIRQLRELIEMHLANDGYYNPTQRHEKVSEIIQNVLIWEENTFNRSDVSHIRNGFSHGHFVFVGDNQVEVWDEKWDGRSLVETYRATLSLAELEEIFSGLLTRFKLLETMLLVNLINAFSQK